MSSSAAFHNRRAGMASLYVMIIFAAASVIALALLERQTLEMDSTSRFVSEEQAMQFALGGETYARQVLFDYTQARDDNDHLKSWTVLQPQFDIPRGTVTLSVEDAGGRFNVNSLLAGNAQADNYFISLCAEFTLDPAVAKTVLTRLQPKRAAMKATGAAAATSASTMMPSLLWLASPSELVDYGLPEAAYRKLAPYMIAVPDQAQDINVNSASSVVLTADLITPVQIAAIQSMINENGTISQDDFGALKLNNAALSLVTASRVFIVHATVTLDGQVTKLQSTVFRVRNNDGTKKLITIARSWGD